GGIDDIRRAQGGHIEPDSSSGKCTARASRLLRTCTRSSSDETKGLYRCENFGQAPASERTGQRIQMRRVSRLASERAFQLRVAPLTIQAPAPNLMA